MFTSVVAQVDMHSRSYNKEALSYTNYTFSGLGKSLGTIAGVFLHFGIIRVLSANSAFFYPQRLSASSIMNSAFLPAQSYPHCVSAVSVRPELACLLNACSNEKTEGSPFDQGSSVSQGLPYATDSTQQLAVQAWDRFIPRL